MRYNTNTTSPSPSKSGNVFVVPKTMGLNGDIHFTASEIESIAQGKNPANLKPSRIFEGRWTPTGGTLEGYKSPMQGAAPEGIKGTTRGRSRGGKK